MINDENLARAKRAVGFAIVVGMILYLSKFLRMYFVNDRTLLFILGFLPNLGLAFAIPFIYVSNRVRLGKPVQHFGIACIITLLLMVLNEIRDNYQTDRVFDVLDICASAAGAILAYLVYRWTFRVTSA